MNGIGVLLGFTPQREWMNGIGVRLGITPQEAVDEWYRCRDMNYSPGGSGWIV